MHYLAAIAQIVDAAASSDFFCQQLHTPNTAVHFWLMALQTAAPALLIIIFHYVSHQATIPLNLKVGLVIGAGLTALGSLLYTNPTPDNLAIAFYFGTWSGLLALLLSGPFTLLISVVAGRSKTKPTLAATKGAPLDA
jgi:hypothetical protein